MVAELASGYNGGTWTGTGITSSSAAANPGIFSVGYADGNTDAGSIAGQNQVVVIYTLAGDATLAGSVGFSDLIVVAQHYGQTGFDWAGGNFTYDASGSVGFADLVIMAQNYGDTTSLAWGGDGGGVLSLAWQSQAAAATPEPMSGLLLASMGMAALGRRNRRRLIR